MAAPSLATLARRSSAEREAVLERCDLCGETIPERHRHLLDLTDHALKCVCRACSILFAQDGAAEGRLRLVPERRRSLAGFELTDAMWEELRLPVDIAFFFRSSAADRVVAMYPSPMGATESLLRLDAWEELEAANPVLDTLTPDVEALLVHRVRGARQQWIVPIDECFRLVGLIRTHWRGLAGGKEVWQQLGRFFDALERGG